MVALARWLMALFGGLLLGCGLTLHGQVALARYAREEVQNTFVLWRKIGQATFYFQGGETRMALAMNEIPPEALRESDRVAWVLLILGGVIAFSSPLVRRSQANARSPKPAARARK
ncbi:MAG: hypothetical protein KDE27_23805 [Planctomycetes bacterium]|nr:hypothetical protein [Planctomycetota bacterium]